VALALPWLIAGCGATGPSLEGADAVPVFCYRWLLDTLCYAEPYPDSDARLLGVYPRDPADPSTKATWLARARAAPMSR
jgi:hypothetical protein